MDRKTIFDVVRRLLGRGFRRAEVAALDRAIDAASRPEPDDPDGEARHRAGHRVSEDGVALIKRFEGCRLTAYPDPGTGGAPWTIGWGTTRIGGEPVTAGMTIDQAEADRLLRADLDRYAAEVAAAIGTAPTTQAQFDALVSFHYNTGAIGRATLTRRHRAGDHTGAAHEFRRWTQAAGRILPGLVRRRAEEAALYLRGSQDGNPPARGAVVAPRGVPTMRHIAAAVAAIALIGSAAVAQGQGQGKGNGQGGGKPAAAASQGGGNGNAQNRGQGNADRGNRGNNGASMAAAMNPDRGNANRGNSDRGNSANADRGNSDRGNGNAAVRAGNDNRGNNGNARAAQAQRGDNGNRGNAPDLVIDRRGGDRDRDRDVLRVRDIASIPRLGLIEGCPPGLAKKNPPCVPPGQARTSTRGLFGLFDRPDFWGLNRLGDGRYFYDDGYLVRYAPSGGILGYVPLLGGALSVGNAWPSFYDPVALPGYYEDYYGLGPYDSYRYADNVVYRVDPETSAITSIAALLTGDRFAVGQPMPPGYDVYNVPYGYRDRYVDGPDGYYRYSDGYVYQVDPETRLIASVIELLV